MEISAALREEITFSQGLVVQSNFYDYKIAKMKDYQEINVMIIESEAKVKVVIITLPSLAQAIMKASFAAIGKRIRRLPIGKQKLV